MRSVKERSAKFEKSMEQANLANLEFKDLPIIDVEAFLNCEDKALSEAAKLESMKVAQCLHKYGICMIRDPRVNEQDNEEYIDMMEQYFEQVGNKHYSGEKVPDIKPECMY